VTAIYLDNASTTKPLPEVLEAMRPYLTEEYGNPSSLYALGRRARKAIDEARDLAADILGVDSKEITFCSGATESISTLLTGAALETDKERRKFVTSSIEHKAVLKTAEWLQQHLGWEVILIKPRPSGHIDPDEFIDACSDGCGLASLQWVNNEIGTIQPVEQIASRLKGSGTPLHTDAVQGLGKMRLDLADSGVAMLSASGHKFYGPKGSGLSYIRERGVKVAKMIIGGGQELERRAGTENVAGSVGLAEALSIVANGSDAFLDRLRDLEKRFLSVLDATGVEYDLNGADPRAPGIINIFFPRVEGESLLLHTDRAGVYISAGSACSSGSTEPSYVVSSLGHDRLRGLCSVRISIGWHNTADEVEEAAGRIANIVAKLQGKT
jgi:cysteine desulfurase